MARYVLIGGKENKDYIVNDIENHLLKMTKIDNPTVLFCPYAVKDINKAIIKFHKLMSGLKCNIIDLTMDNINDFDTLLTKANILYVGGGCDDLLVDIFKEYHLDEILINHQHDNIIYAGSSAGAMLYTKISMGDKYMFMDNYHNYNYKMVNNLGLLNISICPHYQNEDLIIYNDEVIKNKLNSFGIEESTALVIEDNKFYVIKENKRNSVYFFNKNKDYLMIPLYEGIIYEYN